MSEENVYRLSIYCPQCDTGHYMAFKTLGTAIYAAAAVKCQKPLHKPTLNLYDDFGLEEDEITWQTIQSYLATR